MNMKYPLKLQLEYDISIGYNIPTRYDISNYNRMWESRNIIVVIIYL